MSDDARYYSNNFRGVLWLSAGTFFLATVDVFIKTVGLKFHPIEIIFFRYATGLLVLTPVFVHMGWENLRTTKFGLHCTRMVFAFTSNFLLIISVIYLSLADATAYMFSKPLFTTLVAVILLGEVVKTHRWIATAVGFGGVLIILRPGSASTDLTAILAILSALTFAITNVLNRMLSKTEPTNRIMFYYHLFGVALFLGPAIWVWQMPIGKEWFLLTSLGVLSTAALFCFLRAFAVGEASAVGPAENMRLVYAALFGFFLFSEIPSIWTILGATIIIASTYYISRQNS
jgi:drug/metabolite transporter (DMT)-like permease